MTSREMGKGDNEAACRSGSASDDGGFLNSSCSSSRSSNISGGFASRVDEELIEPAEVGMEVAGGGEHGGEEEERVTLEGLPDGMLVEILKRELWSNFVLERYWGPPKRYWGAHDVNV